MTIVARPAVAADVDDIHRLLRAFGRHLGDETWVTGSPAMLTTALFADSPRGHAIVAQRGDDLVGQRFYARLGAREQPEWRLWRIEGAALTALATPG